MYIGRIQRLITDYKRKEIFNAGDYRKVPVSIYYKGNIDFRPEHKSSYSDIFYPCRDLAIETLVNIKGEDRNILTNYETNIYNDIPVYDYENKVPVIIYIPGFSSCKDMCVYNIENLVRNGYIVVTIGPTYESLFSIFPTGEFVRQSPLVLQYFASNIDVLIRERKNDIAALLNELEVYDKEDSFLKGLMDLEHIGAVGHSMGGTTVTEIMSCDNRIKTGINLDGPVFTSKGIDRPFLMFHGESTTLQDMLVTDFKPLISESDLANLYKGFEDELKRLHDFYNNLTSAKYSIKLKGAAHRTFTDSPILIPGNKKVAGDIDPIHAHNIIKTIAASFFNEFLLRKNEDFTDIIENSIYKEIVDCRDYISD